jgi:hypothetical protein
MDSNSVSAPPPDLRIVPTNTLFPHEEHDSQRSEPLVDRLRTEAYVINPPIVASMADETFVILDGANRCHAFARLGYVHSLVQVVSYEAGTVELSTWQHVVCNWDTDKFIQHILQMPDIGVTEGPNKDAIAHVQLVDGRLLALNAPVETTHERNAALRHFVGIYQRNATLHRTAVAEPARIWPLYQDPVALVFFPHYQPADIVAAAEQQAFLPPGISRHIVHGRAIRVNYPIDLLRDTTTTLSEKNAALQRWTEQKVANRQVRYYAEATYQYDE